MNFCDAADYWIAELDGNPVGCCGLRERHGKLWAKSAWVIPTARGYRVYDALYRFRLEEVKRRGFGELYGNYTKMSLGTALRHGGSIIKANGGHSHAVRTLIQ